MKTAATSATTTTLQPAHASRVPITRPRPIVTLTAFRPPALTIVRCGASVGLTLPVILSNPRPLVKPSFCKSPEHKKNEFDRIQI